MLNILYVVPDMQKRISLPQPECTSDMISHHCELATYIVKRSIEIFYIYYHI